MKSSGTSPSLIWAVWPGEKVNTENLANCYFWAENTNQMPQVGHTIRFNDGPGLVTKVEWVPKIGEPTRVNIFCVPA